MSTFKTEIASNTIKSDNPMHQRLLFAYYAAKPFVSGELLEVGCREGRGIKQLAPLAESFAGINKITDVIASSSRL